MQDPESTSQEAKKTRNRKKQINTIMLRLIPVILFTVIFFDSFAALIYDIEFYEKEFEKNDVQLDDRIELTDELFTYFQEGGKLSFNEKEKQHLTDVKNLVQKGFIIYYILIAALVLSISILYYCNRKGFLLNLAKIFLYTALAVIVFSVLSFVLAGKFSFFFIKFHEVLFSNDLWMLNPATDKLIVLFPEQFFIDFTAAVYMRSLLTALLLLWFSLFLKKVS